MALVKSALEVGGSCIFISPDINEAAHKAFSQLPVLLCSRDNSGYDFGALKDIYIFLRDRDLIMECQRMIIVNNSMLMLRPVGFQNCEALQSLIDAKSDLHGITESYETGVYHIQSFHFSLSRRALVSSAFLEFVLSYDTSLLSRDYAISMGELRLTQSLLKAGLSVTSWMSMFSLTSSRSFSLIHNAAEALSEFVGPSLANDASILGAFRNEWLPRDITKYNPSLRAWALLLLCDYPFIKRQLLELGSFSTAPILLPALMDILKLDPNRSDINQSALFLRLESTTKRSKVVGKGNKDDL
ncbi:MAG: hypothetical protein VKN13_05315 [Cyanobacteriota bacterium]|nr:hypothetical protein [Cyanobacteriota bacterium]